MVVGVDVEEYRMSNVEYVGVVVGVVIRVDVEVWLSGFGICTVVVGVEVGVTMKTVVVVVVVGTSITGGGV